MSSEQVKHVVVGWRKGGLFSVGAALAGDSSPVPRVHVMASQTLVTSSRRNSLLWPPRIPAHMRTHKKNARGTGLSSQLLSSLASQGHLPMCQHSLAQNSIKVVASHTGEQGIVVPDRKTLFKQMEVRLHNTNQFVATGSQPGKGGLVEPSNCSVYLEVVSFCM